PVKRMPYMLTVQNLVEDNSDKIPLSWVAGKSAAHRPIPDHGLSAADLVGHLNLIHPSRMQVCGPEEINFYTNFDAGRRLHLLEDLLAGGVPAIVLANDVTAPEDLCQFCDTHGVPLLSSSIEAA